jgi:hypothetical protein
MVPPDGFSINKRLAGKRGGSLIDKFAHLQNAFAGKALPELHQQLVRVARYHRAGPSTSWMSRRRILQVGLVCGCTIK